MLVVHCVYQYRLIRILYRPHKYVRSYKLHLFTPSAYKEEYYSAPGCGFSTVLDSNISPLLYMYVGVPFTLTEVLVDGDPRLFFTQGDSTDTQEEGIITLSEPEIMTEHTVIVYAMVSHC